MDSHLLGPANAAGALPPPVVERGYPLVGAVPSLLRNAPRTLLEAAQRHPGEVFSLRLGRLEVPVVTEPEHLQEVLVDRARDFTRSGLWEVARPMLGYGLVTSDGDYWRRQRRLIQPLFSPKHLSDVTSLMVNAIAAQLELVAARARDGALQVGDEMMGVTQRVLMEAIFGSSISMQEALRLGHHTKTGFRTMGYRLPLHFLPEWVPRPGGRAFFRSIAVLDEALLGMLAARRRKPTDTVDILNQLLAAQDADTGETMTDRQIRDELITLFVAGLDTTAVTLTWMLWLLETHPEVDRRLRAEIFEVLGERTPTYADLAQLRYTKQVIQESMRLYPPGWMFPRYAPEGTVVGGRSIAPGSSLLVCPYVTHRNPRLWDNPHAFDPDRFTAQRSEGRPRLAYLPFGAGSRQCVGTHFAMMESQLAGAMIVQRFRTRLVPGQRIEPASAATLNPRHGIRMHWQQFSCRNRSDC